MKRIFFNNILFRILWPPFYGVMVYLLVLLIFDSINNLDQIFFNQELALCIGLSYLFFETSRLSFIIIERVYPFKDHLWGRMAAQLVQGMAQSALIVGLVLSGYFIYFVGYSFGTFHTELITFMSIFLVTSILYNMVYFSIFFLNTQNEVKLKKEFTLRKNIELQIQSFNNDINPNFLYASLESLITLLHKRGDHAEVFIDHLSAVYRYVLQNKHNEIIDLEEEIKILDSLLHLFNQRHGGNIKWKCDLQNMPVSMIVTGTLLTVLESIINNTIIASHQKLVLECFVEDDQYLVIKHRMNDRLAIDKKSMNRFEDLQESYTYFTSLPLLQVKAYEETFVKIPLLQNFANSEVI